MSHAEESAAEADDGGTAPRLLSELWAEVLRRLPRAHDVCAARAAAKFLRDAYNEHEATILAAVLALPRVQPYCEGNRFSAMGQAGGTELYQEGMAFRGAWRKGYSSQQRLTFPSYVRCVKVNWEAYTDWTAGGIAVGLFDGTVWLSDNITGNGGPNRRAGPGGHADGQVLAIDWVGSLVLSGSGEPSYHERSTTSVGYHPTLRVVSLQRSPFEVVHELGPANGGHTDSINDILIVDEHFDGESLRCTAVTASTDGQLIVWDAVAGRPLRRCVHGRAVTAMARVDGEILLSAGRDGQVREWRWRSGACLRELLLSPSMVPFSAMSYHAATSSFALGNTHGEMCVFRRNPRNDDREPACYPLTSWVSLRGSHMSSHNEVASIQHDGDKVVFSTRAGTLRVAWLGSMPDEGMPIGMYRTGELVRSTAPFEEPSPASFTPGFGLNVRMYVSSATFRGSILVADGFDNQVLVTLFGDESEQS